MPLNLLQSHRKTALWSSTGRRQASVYRVPAGVLRWPAPPKLQNRKGIPGSSSETWRPACPTCLAGSQAGGTEDSHPWQSHIVRRRGPGCASLPSLVLDGSPHLERSLESPGSPKSPADPQPGPFRTTLDGTSDAPWLPGALGMHGPGHLGREEGSRAPATSGGGGGGGASTILAWGQSCGFTTILGPIIAWRSFFILRP